MMDSTPVPAFPAVGVMMHPRHADRVDETEIGAEVVPDIAPGMVGAVTVGDGAGPVHALLSVDLLGHQVERFVPADRLIAGNAPVLRIALAIGIEIDPFHRL